MPVPCCRERGDDLRERVQVKGGEAVELEAGGLRLLWVNTAIAIATAGLGSDGGVIDGCARVHWRQRPSFPQSGDRNARRRAFSPSGRARFGPPIRGRLRGRGRGRVRPGEADLDLVADEKAVMLLAEGLDLQG